VSCETHPGKTAEAVCIICQHAFCEECASWIQGRFLCQDHYEYEIYEGMARVYGTSDPLQAQFIHSSLTDVGLHSFVYSRKTNSISLGGADYNLFRPHEGKISINEIKVMVPCDEVLQAEQVINDIECYE